MKVVEKFISINGEGTRAGELAVFIRFKGCNLNCSYCDTTWANEHDCDYEEMSPAEVYEYIKSTGVKNVTLTGGEPLLQADMGKLLDMLLADKSIRVEIETNGSVSLQPYIGEKRPYFTMDYKLPTSQCEAKMNTENFSVLEKEDTVKFVAGSEEDLQKTKQIVEKFDLTKKCHVYISPVFGNFKPVQIVDFLKDNCLNEIRLQIQMHKVIWEPSKKGV